jgi:predicted amino acid dehydrogenase
VKNLLTLTAVIEMGAGLALMLFLARRQVLQWDKAGVVDLAASTVAVVAAAGSEGSMEGEGAKGEINP